MMRFFEDMQRLILGIPQSYHKVSITLPDFLKRLETLLKKTVHLRKLTLLNCSDFSSLHVKTYNKNVNSAFHAFLKERLQEIWSGEGRKFKCDRLLIFEFTITDGANKFRFSPIQMDRFFEHFEDQLRRFVSNHKELQPFIVPGINSEKPLSICLPPVQF